MSSDQEGVPLQDSSDAPEAVPAAPLQHYFTLPFALHLRPLPHISFLAQHDSQDTSEAEQSDRASTSSHRSNYRAGTHRLEPSLQSVPAHSLATISTLLENTGCLEAVPIWSELIVLLQKADNDPHFTNLRRFFDARFDSQGRAISSRTDLDDEDSSVRATGLFKKRTNSLARRTSQGQSSTRSPHLGIEESSRRGSNVSRRASNSALMRARSKSRASPSQGVVDEAVMESDEESGSIRGNLPQSPIQLSPHKRQHSRTSRLGPHQSQKVDMSSAPEIIVTKRKPQLNATSADLKTRARATSVRPVRFRIRLDLHTVNLAPRPPQARLSTLQPISTFAIQSQNSIPRSAEDRSELSSDSHLEIRRITSPGGASSDQSHDESLSLHPVNSPDSLRSRTISEGSHNDEYRLGKFMSRNRDGLPSGTSPSRKGFNNTRKDSSIGKSKRPARTMTGSSAATAQTSVFGTSSEGGGDDGAKGSFGGRQRNVTSGGEKRRPSILQRFMSFGGKKGGSTARSLSNDRINEQPIANLTKQDSIESSSQISAQLPNTLQSQISGDPSSPVMIEAQQTPSFALAMQRQQSGDRRSRLRSGDQSDLSNEDALDLAEDDGSIGSSGAWSRVNARRRSSFGPMSPNMALLQPVDEDRAFENVSKASPKVSHQEGAANLSAGGGGIDMEEEEWADKSDFLTLLRRAAQITLHLTKEASRKKQLDEDVIRTPKSSSTLHSLQSPSGSGSMETSERKKMESLLAPFIQKGHEENPESWWLCGSADPLPIAFACALSQALGWQGIMELCYGKGSRCEKSGTYRSLGKAAELNDRQEVDVNKVRNWVQNINTEEGISASGVKENADDVNRGKDRPVGEDLTSSAGPMSDVAPSESASAVGKVAKQGFLSKWMDKLPTRGGDDNQGGLDTAATSKEIPDPKSREKFEAENRSWQDWADLLASIASWMEEYETCRVRNGLAKEMDRQTSKMKVNGRHADSGFVDASPVINEEDKMIYSSLASYRVPRCVILDALNEDNGFRRRHGIPEGLPLGLDGEEHEDYRWARKKLSSSQFTSSLLLGTLSFSYFFGQMASADWTHDSAWELDYLEMCVFHSDIISSRFPSPGTSIVPSEQMYQPSQDDVEAKERAKTCPYPRSSIWDSQDWQYWLQSVKNGLILVPAVSFQAWWTLIAVLNGADGSGRTLDLQVKSAEEPFEALDDLNSIYM